MRIKPLLKFILSIVISLIIVNSAVLLISKDAYANHPLSVVALLIMSACTGYTVTSIFLSK